MPISDTERAITGGHFRDLLALRAIQKQSFRPGLAYSIWVLFTLWLLPFVTFRVARTTAGTPIGVIIADRDKTQVRIINIAVHRQYRRQGIGRTLLNDIQQQLPKGNIVLMVEEHNTGAQALYTETGFNRTGFRQNYYGAGHNGIEMTLIRHQKGTS